MKLLYPGTLAYEVKMFRKHLKLNQDGAAVACDVSPATIAKIENGGRPTEKVYAKLAKWMGLAIDAVKGLKCKASLRRLKLAGGTLK